MAISKACPNLALNLWYLDDGIIAGKSADVMAALRIIQNLGPEMGMDLKLKKNELVKFTSEPDDFPKDFKRFYRNFELLGAPRSEMKSFAQSLLPKKSPKSLSILSKQLASWRMLRYFTTWSDSHPRCVKWFIS